MTRRTKDRLFIGFAVLTAYVLLNVILLPAEFWRWLL